MLTYPSMHGILTVTTGFHRNHAKGRAAAPGCTQGR